MKTWVKSVTIATPRSFVKEGSTIILIERPIAAMKDSVEVIPKKLRVKKPVKSVI